MDILVKNIGPQTKSYTDERARCLEEVQVIIAPVYQLCLIVTSILFEVALYFITAIIFLYPLGIPFH